MQFTAKLCSLSKPRVNFRFMDNPAPTSLEKWVTLGSGFVTVTGFTLKDAWGAAPKHPAIDSFLFSCGVGLVVYGFCMKKAGFLRWKAVAWGAISVIFAGLLSTVLILEQRLHAMPRPLPVAARPTPQLTEPQKLFPPIAQPAPLKASARHFKGAAPPIENKPVPPAQTIQSCPNGNCIVTNNGNATVNNFAPPELKLSPEQASIITSTLKAQSPLKGKISIDAVGPVSSETYEFIGALTSAIKNAQSGLEIVDEGTSTFNGPMPKGVSFGGIGPGAMSAANAIARALVQAAVVPRNYKFSGHPVITDSPNETLEIEVNHL